ncbi:YagE family protein [Bimuria novae-zelandiae CBS 107.79]|uniref:YagE family protein n=1 Tax=Bimuria novae-zelandiae CBS 107.79 TaxID=1447943 RepID=A0A6A5UUZ8_9PLEO|nr:YagE family protein [Bimuria novae-zelandiae CBS 107.79]
MASSSTETTPLISSMAHGATGPRPVPARPHRSVTFNPTVISSSPKQPPAPRPSTGTNAPSHGGKPMMASLNNRLRRRNSSGGAMLPHASPAPKIGPQRTTRTAQKLKLLPDPEHGEEDEDEESGRDVYVQYTRIKDPTARRDAARLGKADRERLPRVTAYCTAASYKMDDLMRYLKGKARLRGAQPKRFDECIYSPYNYGTKGPEKVLSTSVEEEQPERQRRYSDSAIEVDAQNERRREDLIDLHDDNDAPSLDNGEPSSPPSRPHPIHSESDPSLDTQDFDILVHTPEVFLFDYGTVVLWGFTVAEEKRFLRELAKFETDKLGKDEIETEEFNFYYTREYQARIYNDFISLRDKKNYMIKLAISHGLSQSVKTSLFEDLVDNTIDDTKDIPAQIARSGKINLNKKQINMQIGELFILRISIHLQGSVLDAPELMWAEPQLDPVYQAVRSYLEMDQRVGLLTERLNVIGDLLAVLKDQLTVTHGEMLEWIVIILVAAEVVVAAINIFVDLNAAGE